MNTRESTTENIRQRNKSEYDRYETRTSDMSHGLPFNPNASRTEGSRETEVSSTFYDASIIDNEYEIYERPTAPQITVITLPKSGSCYNMNHRNQGKVIVFNHKEVDGEEIREGTQQDVERITKTFSNLGFEVIVHNDLILEEIKKVLEKLGSSDYSDDNCLVIFVLTHGTTEGLVKAKDDTYKLQAIWETFTGDKCRSLIGKPKLLFCQACRGPNFDAGTEVVVNTAETDSVCESVSFNMPKHADLMIGYSSFENFVSVRYPGEGTLYIQTLCDVLDSYGETDDMLSMMTTVARIVGTSRVEGHAQMPTVTSTLMRKLYFYNIRQNVENQQMSS